jgi:hypothetical protein
MIWDRKLYCINHGALADDNDNDKYFFPFLSPGTPDSYLLLVSLRIHLCSWRWWRKLKEQRAKSEVFTVYVTKAAMIRYSMAYIFRIISFQIGNPMTLFAPTNDAFDLMPSRVKEILENADNMTTARKSSLT